ncbi:MAG TPA: branched-chain amino acid ABC transporter permease [Hyphomicrobiales bacterium]|nr:branched-chain amino acid ABC transporter permease [Hyphomicrobiales bacterium]
MSSLVAAFLNSLEIGMLLFVIASGLTIVFGVLGILNFAHGALYMLGAYFAFTLVKLSGLPHPLGLLLAPLVVAVLAVVIEKFILNRVYGRHETFGLLLTFALLLILDDSVRLIWGPGYQIIDPPEILQGTFTLLGATQPVYSLFIIASGVLIGGFVWLLFNKTRIGKVVRAAAIDREMAGAVGIDVPLVFTLVFAFGAWLAALGGALAAPIRALGPAMGDTIIIESFVVVVIGGLGSFPGALIGALILGFIHGFGGRWLSELDIVLPYLGMALVLLLRPQGLMGRTS